MINNATVLEINQAAIQHNLAYFKAKLHKKTKILVVVKAFAYGSDALILSEIVAQQQVDYLAVAYTQEGVNLRKAGIKLPILVLHPQIQNFKRIIENCLEPNLYSEKTLDAFIDLSKKMDLQDYPIHLKFNTGLNRLGFAPDKVSEVIERVKKESSIQLRSVFSHLAASEDLNEREFTLTQISRFKEIKRRFEEAFTKKPMFHLLNTSGILNYADVQFDMVRLGIGIYGFGNEEKYTLELKSVLTLKSIISQIHTLPPNETVGYNRAWETKEKTRMATIPIGHADGISRQLGNAASYVVIHGKKAPIIGNVCMDMIMVDVTQIDCKETDEVIIFDSQKKVEEMAKKMNTIPYELLTMISQRVHRVVKK